MRAVSDALSRWTRLRHLVRFPAKSPEFTGPFSGGGGAEALGPCLPRFQCLLQTLACLQALSQQPTAVVRRAPPPSPFVLNARHCLRMAWCFFLVVATAVAIFLVSTICRRRASGPAGTSPGSFLRFLGGFGSAALGSESRQDQ